MTDKPEMTEYTVYETYDDHRNRIGSVEARTLEMAIERAHRTYGGPIEVERA